MMTNNLLHSLLANSTKTNTIIEEEEEVEIEENSPSMFDQMMQRGEFLRQLRLLEQADEEERQRQGRRRKHKHEKMKECQLEGVTFDSNTAPTTIEKIITNESMDIVHENTRTKERRAKELMKSKNKNSSISLSTSNKRPSESELLTRSTMYSDNSIGSSSYGDEKKEEVEKDDFEYDDSDDDYDEEEGFDRIDVLPYSKLNVLRYDSYLLHQRYNDDYKHANCHFVDLGYLGGRGREHRLILEQQRSLGKGGLIWDAGVILGDHLIAVQNEWLSMTTVGNTSTSANTNAINTNNITRIVELGAGTGVTGMMVAKAVPNTHVHVTDLPDVMRLLERNVKQNFRSECIKLGGSTETAITDEKLVSMDRGGAAQNIPNVNRNILTLSESSSQLSDEDLKIMYKDDNDEDVNVDDTDSRYDNNAEFYQQSNSTAVTCSQVTPKVLRWGMKEDYIDGPFDVIIAADVVTSLYDPRALAQTIYDLSHEKSVIYVSMKKRLDEYEMMFEETVKTLFGSVNVSTLSPITRHRNLENICIFKVNGRRRSNNDIINEALQ